MVDNVTLNAGSGGATIKTDDDGTAHWPYSKLAWGPDNTQTRVNTGSAALPAQGAAAHDAAAAGNPLLVGAEFDDTLPDSVDEGDVGRLRISANRNLYSTIRDAAGNERGLNVDANGEIGVTLGNATLPDTSASDLATINSNTDYGAVVGGGVEATALRVTLASDSTGVLSVDDNGGALTVDNAGTFAVQVDGNALTSLQLIDDAIHADDAAFTLGTSKGVMIMGFAGTQSVNANDAAALACDTDGALHIADGGNSITVDNGGTFAVQVDAALPAGTNAIGKLSANSGVDIGDVDVTSISAGSNLIGDVGISGARTSGGTTPYKNLDVDESEDQVKGTAGQVYWVHAMNLAATKRYLKFYNATAATVSVGTTVPVLTFALPTQGDTNGAGFNFSVPNGIAFDTAITIAATTGVADNDTGAPGANEVVVNLGYA